MRRKIVFLMVVATTLIFANVSYGQNSPAPAASGSPIDATLFTTYTIDSAHTNVSWLVCGSTQNTSGCYASGNLGPFGKVGALMEGNPKTDLSTNTVTRAIYVLDIASGSNLNEVELSVYTKTDTITPDFDTVSVTLSKTVSLPLVGGTSAGASMAANNKFLFIGTNRSPGALSSISVPLASASLAGSRRRSMFLQSRLISMATSLQHLEASPAVRVALSYSAQTAAFRRMGVARTSC